MIPLPASVTLKGIWAALIALAFAVLLALLAVQTVRLEGMKFWPVKVEGWIAKADRFKAERDAVFAAAVQARAAQIAVNQAEQDRINDLAERTDHANEVTRVIVRDATAAFIDRNRVRTDAGSLASATDSPAGGDGAGQRAELPTGFVLVSELDVQRCGEWQAYGVNAYQWAIDLATPAPQPYTVPRGMAKIIPPGPKPPGVPQAVPAA